MIKKVIASVKPTPTVAGAVEEFAKKFEAVKEFNEKEKVRLDEDYSSKLKKTSLTKDSLNEKLRKMTDIRDKAIALYNKGMKKVNDRISKLENDVNERYVERELGVKACEAEIQGAESGIAKIKDLFEFKIEEK